ncbi:RING finger protein 214 isoform X1 [Electrophorus electricus]|nr:RING finger protein 214 isoform X1 [Electrophorus electricus]XP_026884428.2 RING finger protein 214 isoform X1 [Electrophorus electricus]
MDVPRTDWCLACDEDLVGRRDDPVAPPYTSPWDIQTNIWSAPNSFASGSETAESDVGFFEHKDFVTMPVNTEIKDQNVQTENLVEEKGNNTNDDWHLHMRSIDEHSTLLAQQYEALIKQQASGQADHKARIEALGQRRDEKKSQHQSLLMKIESLHVKLDLNSSKTTRKNFIVKLEELKAEKERMLDGQRRLAQELEEVDKKLKMLIEEQSSEKISWQKDIDDLQAEKDIIVRQVEETSQAALKDEIAAVESQREVAVSQVEDWIAEAERYLGTLRLDPSPQHGRQRLEWEKNVVAVRNGLTGLQNKYDENLKLLQKGQQLDILPTIPLPSLPVVPTIDLFMSPLINSIQSPYFSSAMLRAPPPSSVALPQFHTAHRLTPPPVVSQSLATLPLTPSAHATEHNPHGVMAMAHAHKPQLTMPTAFPPRLPTYPTGGVPLSRPLPHSNGMPNLLLAQPSTYATVAPTNTSTATARVALPSGMSQLGVPASQAAGPHVQAAVGQARGAGLGAQMQNSSSTSVPSNPPPAGKLDQLLERLGMLFPECTRNQLTGVLQQIKSERGTMAGLSIDDLTQQVAQRLVQGERPAPGPIGPRSGSRDLPGPPGPVQRPPGQPLPPVHPHVQVFQPRTSQQMAPSVCKLCLMCQNHVEAGTQYITNCPHTLHKECISVWLQSSKNNPCPFCPSK